MSKLSDVIEKVEKLLRLADQGVGGEAENAQRMAQELITKYQIEEAQINQHTGTGGVVSMRIDNPGPWAIDKAILLNYIAKHNFCKVLRGDGYVMLYGFDSDIKIVTALYGMLSLDMVSQMRNALEEHNEYATNKTWVKSFFGGYAIGIGDRLRESKSKVIKETHNKSVELVVANKQHAVEQYFQSIDRKPQSKRSLASTSGFQAGIHSASQANIGQTGIDR